MANQEESPSGVPHKDSDHPSPDVGRNAADGQSGARAKGASEDQGSHDYRGDGPGKIGLTSDEQPDLVARSGVNEGAHGAADDKPMAGGSLNFDDDDMAHPRGKATAAGGTRDAQGADSAPLGPPGAGLSNRNGPSDPGNRKQ